MNYSNYLELLDTAAMLEEMGLAHDADIVTAMVGDQMQRTANWIDSIGNGAANVLNSTYLFGNYTDQNRDQTLGDAFNLQYDSSKDLLSVPANAPYPDQLGTLRGQLTTIMNNLVLNSPTIMKSPLLKNTIIPAFQEAVTALDAEIKQKPSPSSQAAAQAPAAQAPVASTGATPSMIPAPPARDAAKRRNRVVTAQGSPQPDAATVFEYSGNLFHICGNLQAIANKLDSAIHVLKNKGSSFFAVNNLSATLHRMALDMANYVNQMRKDNDGPALSAYHSLTQTPDVSSSPTLTPAMSKADIENSINELNGRGPMTGGMSNSENDRLWYEWMSYYMGQYQELKQRYPRQDTQVRQYVVQSAINSKKHSREFVSALAQNLHVVDTQNPTTATPYNQAEWQ